MLWDVATRDPAHFAVTLMVTWSDARSNRFFFGILIVLGLPEGVRFAYLSVSPEISG